MNRSRSPGNVPSFIILCLAMVWARFASGQTTVYSTSFEPEEGYDPKFTLIGQGGWQGFGFGGNGIVTNFFEGFGQQAYIGYTAPENPNNFFNVFRPINLSPISPSFPVLKFSVLMQIVDSKATNGPWDDFRWSIYNTNGNRLFSLDFDNSSLLVSYVLDDNAGFISTNSKFDNQGSYELAVSMNFARNLWSATLNDQVIVHAKQITTIGAPLNLGDIDAVWYMRDPAAPGDNYMLFDDYAITAESGTSIAPRLESIGVKIGYQARVYAEPGLNCRVETSTDFQHWTPLLTNTPPANGIFEFQDPAPPTTPRRFYRLAQGL